MNFQQLEYALAVHRHKHFGNASDSCHITQATLSAMVKKLENELGKVLFDRSRNPVKTTDFGLQFIEIAKDIIEQRNKLLQLGSKKLEELQGTITLGIIPTVANTLLPIILPTLLKENPNLQLNITEITTENIVAQLMQDNIDIGLLSTPLNNELIEETILYYEAMMVYGVKESKKKYIGSEDIKNQKVWLLEEGNCFREQSLTICEMKEKDLESTNLNFEGSSFETLLNLTDKFGGCTLIPELYYNTLPADKKKLTKPFKAPIPVREISLVSSRPYERTQTIDYLSHLIKRLVERQLSTSLFKAKDLEIIGF